MPPQESFFEETFREEALGRKFLPEGEDEALRRRGLFDRRESGNQEN